VVQLTAVSTSRHSGCEDGSPRRRRAARSRSLYSSSEWNAARRFVRAGSPHALVVLDQQRARGRAHEHLDPRRAGQPLEIGYVTGILPRAADPEREVAMHAVAAPPDLVDEGLGRRGLRVGVGHLEDGRDAS
jgi:hypothetical protein